MKSLKMLAVILAILCALSAVAFVITGREASEPEESESNVYSYEASAYTARVSPASDSGKIFMPMPVTGLYYTADLKNNVEFWQLTEAGFLPSSYETKSFSVNLNASGQSIPVKMKYVTVDGANYGIGLFTSETNSSVKYYDYAFVQLCPKPKGYGSGYLLLADYTKEDFYRDGKTFNDIFEYNMSASSVSISLSQNTRLVDSNATYKQSWDMLTNEFIGNIGEEKYFMSSRYYTDAELGKRTDIMVYSSAYRPSVVYSDILGDWFVLDGSGAHYLKKDGSGFKCLTVKDKKTVKETSFESDYFENYLRSGNYLFEKSTGKAYNLLTGDTVAFVKGDYSGADIFSISPDGKKAVIAFNAETNMNGAPVQRVVYCSADSNSTDAYSEPLLFCEESGFVWLNDSSVMSARPLDETGSGFGSVVYSFS